MYNVNNITKIQVAIAQTIKLAQAGNTLITGYPLPQTAIPSATVGNVYGVATMSTFAPTSTLSDKNLYPYFSRIAVSIIDNVITSLDTLEYYESIAGYGWKNIGILSTIDPYNLDFGSLVVKFGESRNFNILAYQQILISFDIGNVTVGDISLELNEIKKSKCRVIYGLTAGSTFPSVITAANEFGIVGENYVWVVATPTITVPFDPLPIAQGTLGLTNYIPPIAKYSECFIKAWQTANPIQFPFAGRGIPPPPAKIAFDAFLTVALALNKLDQLEMLPPPLMIPPTNNMPLPPQNSTISPQIWSEFIRSVEFEGLTGNVSFKDNGDRIMATSVAFYNLTENRFIEYAVKNNIEDDSFIQLRDVIWYSNTTDIPDLDVRDGFYYWSCDDKEKKFDSTGKTIQIHSPDLDDSLDDIDIDYHCDHFIDCNNLSDESSDCSSNYLIIYILFGIITVLCILCCILCFIFVIIFGFILGYQRIKIASPFFLIVLLISIFLGFCSIFTFYGKPHPVACAFQPWLLGLPAVSMISTLLVKNFRIWKIFHSPLKRTRITDIQLFIVWIIIMIPAFIIIILWTAISTPTAKLKDIDGADHFICTTGGVTGEPGGLVFFFIFVGYCTIILLIGALISILIRNVPTAFNESKLMTISIYNLGFLAAVIIPVFLVVQAVNPFLAWILRTCAVLYAFSATMVLQFLPKLVGILILDKGKRRMQSEIVSNKSSSTQYSQ